MKSPLRALAALAAVAALAIAASSGFTFAAFSGQTANPGNRVTAASDLREPAVTSTVVGKVSGGADSYIKQASTYYVYANVTDLGSPPSGTAAVTADVSNVTTGVTAAPLVPGSYSRCGTTYNYRTAALLANVTLSEGSKPYTITTIDNDVNSGTQGGFSVTADNTAIAPSDVQAVNVNSIVGRAQINDTITYTFSEPVDPATVGGNCDGSTTNVVTRLVNNGLLGLGGDTIEIYNAADSAALNLGVVDLGGSGYVGGLFGGETARFGATGTPSTMDISGNTVTITLGTASGQAATTSGGNTTMTWLPDNTATDRAANASTTPNTNESGGADREF